jgi:hypothetical protein
MKQTYILKGRFPQKEFGTKFVYVIAVEASSVEEAKKLAKEDGYIYIRRIGIPWNLVSEAMQETYKPVRILFQEYTVQ